MCCVSIIWDEGGLILAILISWNCVRCTKYIILFG